MQQNMAPEIFQALIRLKLLIRVIKTQYSVGPWKAELKAESTPRPTHPTLGEGEEYWLHSVLLSVLYWLSTECTMLHWASNSYKIWEELFCIY